MSNQTLNDDGDYIEDVVPTSWVDDAPKPPTWVGLVADTQLEPDTQMGGFNL